MKYHPSNLMLLVWSGAFMIFYILPFQLTYRSFKVEGFLILGLFLIAFCLGALLKTLPMKQRIASDPFQLSFKQFDRVLKFVAIIACVVFILEIIIYGRTDLAEAYIERSERAQSLLKGGLSGSSMLFKVGFLTYPVGYVYIARHLIFEGKIQLFKLLIYGFLPGILATVAMGGRTQLFYSIAIAILSYRMRGKLSKVNANNDQNYFKRLHLIVKILGICLGVLVLNFFINVFIVRAAGVGGIEQMLSFVASQWGVTFEGPHADLMIDIFGPGTTYLIFVFNWYLVQGLVMSNTLFVNYEGDALYGVYGVDVFSALMRRVNGEQIARDFDYLLNMDTYGFLPSAFGTLYVDYLYFGIIIAGIWGWLSALVYRKIKTNSDDRYKLWAPFVVFGILFSLINTPFGFSNGFVVYVWLFVLFKLIGRKRTHN